MYFTRAYVNDNQLAQPPASSPLHEAIPTQQQPTPMTSPRSYHDGASRSTPGTHHGYSRPPPPPPAPQSQRPGPQKVNGSPHFQSSYGQSHHMRTHSQGQLTRPRSSDDAPPDPHSGLGRQEEGRKRRQTTGVATSPSMHVARRHRSNYPPAHDMSNDSDRRPTVATRPPESWEWYYYGDPVPLSNPVNQR